MAAFALGALLFLFVTLSIGVFISTVSQTQGQAIQLAIMTLLPQILLSGLFFPISSMAAGVRWIAYVLPLTYFVKIARGVMVRGEPIGALWFSFLMLAVLGRGGVHPVGAALPARPGGGAVTADERPAASERTDGAAADWGVDDLTVRFATVVALDGVELPVPPRHS